MNLSLSYILVESILLYKNDHLHTAILAPFYQKMTNQFYCQGGQWPLIQFSGMKCNQQTDRYTEEVEISNLPLAFGHIKVKKSSLVGPPTGNSGFFFLLKTSQWQVNITSQLRLNLTIQVSYFNPSTDIQTVRLQTNCQQSALFLH